MDIQDLDLFEMFLSETSDFIFVKDIEHKFVLASEAFAKLFGFENANELLGKTDFEVFSNETATQYFQLEKYVIEQKKKLVNHSETFFRLDGTKGFFSTVRHPIIDKSGVVIGCYGIYKDITHTMELQHEKFLRSISFDMYDCVLEADMKKNSFIGERANKFLRSINIDSNITYDEVIKKIADSFVKKEHRKKYLKNMSRDNVLALYRTGTNELEFEYKQDNDIYKCHAWIKVVIKIYFSPFTNSVRAVIYEKNIDREKKHLLSLAEKAERDLHTGFFNKTTTEVMIQQYLDSDCAKSGRHAFLIIDIDNFKSINDQFGHLFGDKIIKKIVSKLNEFFRSTDIIGRVGGDEFVVLMKDAENLESIMRRLKSLSNSLNEDYVNSQNTYKISASIGVAIYPEHGISFGDLYNKSDCALYHRKNIGKGDFSIFNDEIGENRGYNFN